MTVGAVWTREHIGNPWTNQTTFGGHGPGLDGFIVPMDVAVSADELTVWVANNASRISVWTRPNVSGATWSPQTTFGSYGTGPAQFQITYGLAVSADELTVWVVDMNNDRISVWTRPNVSSTTWSPQTTSAVKVMVPTRSAVHLA